MRYIIKRRNKSPLSSNLKKILDNEKKNNLDNLSSCLKFKTNCEASKKNITDRIYKIKEWILFQTCKL